MSHHHHHHHEDEFREREFREGEFVNPNFVPGACPDPNFVAPGAGMGYQQPVMYPEQGGFAQGGFAQGGFGQPGYGQPGYGQPMYGEQVVCDPYAQPQGICNTLVNYRDGDSMAFFPNGLAMDREVFIHGTPFDQQQFTVNLRCGPSEGSDVALHFCPQFTNNRILMRTFHNSNWEHEEHHHHVPFICNAPVKLGFKCGQSHFHISHGGQELCRYPYRIHELNRISHVQVEGMNVNKIEVL